MENKISIEAFYKELQTNDFIQRNIPMGYTPGFPVLRIKNDYLCLQVPFLKYKITGEIDSTLVYPIRYIVEYVLPEKRLIAYEDLLYNTSFKSVNFAEPCGLFRHKAIQDLTKSEYQEKRTELFKCYDEVISVLLDGTSYDPANESRMINLMRELIEPSQYAIYRVLDNDFYNKYLNHN